MKFNLNNEDKQKLNNLIEAKNINVALADMFLETTNYRTIGNNSIFASSKDVKSSYLEAFYDFFELNMEDEDNVSISKAYIEPAIKVLDTRDYQSNSYYKTIKFQNIKIGNYSLSLEKYNAYQSFSYDDVDILSDDYYHEISKMGFFKCKYPFISLLEKDTIWMCITPNEINTMKKPIQDAFGNVITFGLGLGYFAFMASKKKNVKTVTIIEKDEKIIELFNEALLPQFPYKEKIRIIKDDALKYMYSKDMQKYDYAFFDLWHNPEDGLPCYIKIKKIEKELPNVKFSYWLEKSIIAMYRRCFITLMEEELEGKVDNDYINRENEIDDLINSMHFKWKNHTFNSYKEINDLLNDKNIVKELSK